MRLPELGPRSVQIVNDLAATAHEPQEDGALPDFLADAPRLRPGLAQGHRISVPVDFAGATRILDFRDARIVHVKFHVPKIRPRLKGSMTNLVSSFVEPANVFGRFDGIPFGERGVASDIVAKCYV